MRSSLSLVSSSTVQPLRAIATDRIGRASQCGPMGNRGITIQQTVSRFQPSDLVKMPSGSVCIFGFSSNRLCMAVARDVQGCYLLGPPVDQLDSSSVSEFKNECLRIASTW
jgi:hypothetical protein